MTAHRLRRILAVGALACALGSPAPLRLAAFAVAASPPQPTVQFDSIAVDFPHFSPNGDRRRDVVTVSYYLSQSTYVKIYVHAVGVPDTLAILANNTIPVRGRQTANWTGKTAQGMTLPDADYVLEFTGMTSPDSVPLHNQRTVTIDTAAPSVAILEFIPPVYTPTLPATPANLRVKVRAGQSFFGDSLIVVAKKRIGTQIQEFRLRLLGNFAGDGDYTAQCDSCAKASTFPDSTYQVEARLIDAAANADTARGHFDKDIQGPTTQVFHPQPPQGSSSYNFLVQYADSVRGTATDRHGVRRVAVHITPQGGSTDSLVAARRPAGSDTLTYGFQVDLSGPLAAEGNYTVVLIPEDNYGVAEGFTPLKYTVDRTAPPKPNLAPRPGPVSKTEQIHVALTVDSTATARVVRSGGANPSQSQNVALHTMSFEVTLLPGANHLAFTAFDGVGNASPPETTTVAWEPTEGMAVPERFHAGNSIQLHAGNDRARGAEVHIYATDGSLVQKFESTAAQFVYSFTWNLDTPDGRHTKNGAYLVQAIIHHGDGSDERFVKLIAVLE